MAKKDSSPAERAHVFYSGRVQGVGFRYLAEDIAHRTGVRGFVKNLPDGRVEVVCEGPKEKIDAFLSQVRESTLARYIQKTDCLWEEPAGTFTDFTIEFHY